MANLDLSILNTLGNDISASKVRKGDVLISSSLLSNAKVMKGDVEVQKVMQGDNEIWELQTEQVLPYDAQVEYLMNDGTAYIDTGVVGSSTTKFDISIYLPTTPTNGSIFPFGARKVFNSNCLEWLRDKGEGHWQYRYGNKYVSTSFGSSAVDGDYTINNLSVQRTVAFTCGGTSHSITCTANTFNTGLNVFLFCLNNNGTPRSTEAGIKIYASKFYNGSTLVRDYIPVRKNGIGYLYDKVSGTLFGNAAASGAFTYGNDVNT